MTARFVHLLEELQRRSMRMASLVEDILQEACEALFDVDEKLADRVIARDNEVDSEEVQIEAQVVKLMALYQPVGSDLRLLCTILKVNNDLERIADCAVNIAERTRHLRETDVSGQRGAIEQMASIVRRMLRKAVHAHGAQDAESAQDVFSDEEAVDALYVQTIRSVVASASHDPDRTAALLDILSVGKNFERIADHATNIAEDVMFLTSGEIVRHRQR